MAQTSYRIGEVAEATGFPLTTLRYYEQRGVLPPPDRSPAGHRVYGQHHVELLELIARAKRLGLTLDEAAVLADAWQHQPCSITHGQLVAFLENKLADVREQIAELTRFSWEVDAVYAQVAGRSATEETCGRECACAPALTSEATPTEATGGLPRVASGHAGGPGGSGRMSGP